MGCNMKRKRARKIGQRATWGSEIEKKKKWNGPAGGIWPKTARKKESLLIFKYFTNLQTIYDSNQICNFDDFRSHNKIIEHFTTQRKICIA
jgi:hypothetical protein